MKDKTIPKTLNTAPKSNQNYHDLERENKQLKKELKRAEMEREILKKTTEYFASQEL